MEAIQPLNTVDSEKLINKNIDSVLNDVKDSLDGMAEDYNEFDTEICSAINTELSILAQLGVIKPFRLKPVQNDSIKWSDLIGEDMLLFMARQCVKDRVKLIFDPPTSGTLHSALERRLEEMEWRAKEAAEFTK